jgi:acylglycerol lipase
MKTETCFAIGIVEREEYKNKARFLYGESMGGAVVLYIHWKEPHEWNGAILIAPMCKVGLF